MSKSLLDIAANTGKLARKTRKKVEKTGGLEPIPATCGQCNRWTMYSHGIEGLEVPMCTHPDSYDSKGSPMFVMLNYEPEEFCGKRRRKFFTMMQAAEEAKGQVLSGKVDMAKDGPLMPGVILGADGNQINRQDGAKEETPKET